MIEPTETESRETLEAFAGAVRAIVAEDPEYLHNAPHTTPDQQARRSQGGQEPRSSVETAIAASASQTNVDAGA